MAYPLGMVQMPLHRFTDAGLKRFCRTPAQRFFDLAGVNGVAAVVARPVFHKADLLAVRAAASPGPQLIEQAANGVHDVDIGLFVPAAYVVHLARRASFKYPANGAAISLT